MLREPAMWMSSHSHTSPLNSLMTFSPSPPRETACYAWHGTKAVTLTWDAPLSVAQGPGISVSRIEPLGVWLSRFWLSSSRSLGRCLLLGQRSRMNLFSDYIRSLFHQDHGNSHTEFSRHRHNGDSRSEVARMGLANRAEKLSQLRVFSDRRPGSLDELASQPSVSRLGDRSPIGSISGGVLGGHQSQTSSQLADVFKLAPLPDAGQKLPGHNPADPRHAHHILHAPGQFGIVLTEAAHLLGGLNNLLLVKLQTVKQLIELKAYCRGAGKLSQFILDQKRPLTASGSRGKLQPFEQQQRFDALLHPHHRADKGVAQLGEVTKLAIDGRGNMNAFELSLTQILRQPHAVEPIGFHSLSWSFGDHRWRSNQARVILSHKPIIQSVSRRSSFIGKGHFLIGKMLTYMVHQMLHTIRHTQGSDMSLLIDESHRNTSLVHIQSAQHIVVTGNESVVSHLKSSFAQWRSDKPSYSLKRTCACSRHPSYKSHHERVVELIRLST